jgi:hypothetical protein
MVEFGGRHHGVLCPACKGKEKTGAACRAKKAADRKLNHGGSEESRQPGIKKI